MLFFLTLCLLAWLSPMVAQAENYSAEVKTANMTRQGDRYALSADIIYRLSPKALEALQNGVPLFWIVRIKTQQARNFFWNKTLAETSLRYRLQYHALLNMYRVRNEGTDDMHNFSTLAGALDSMSTLRDLPLINENAVALDHELTVELKIVFDRDALPLPLRPVAYMNRQWYLSSDWTVWHLKK
ncbi:MAG: DUF4390 domain-containing protein [Methylovulum sp.]|nr:DUF4390 domain-containing protein [Methylovulum sp.]